MSIVHAIFAAGSFWSAQATFDSVPGVVETQTGYMGSQYRDPTYLEVKTGRTGHSEAVDVSYDATKVSYENLLDVFFNAHNPTVTGRQGLEPGKQYQSVVFYVGDWQKEAAEKKISEINSSGRFSQPLITEVRPADRFYPAENYNQKLLHRRTNRLILKEE